VLDLGLPKWAVKWKKVKTALERMVECDGVLRALAAHVDSIGWELFLDYRNWVTHRGAPIVISALSVPVEIDMPSDEGGSQWSGRAIDVAEVINNRILDNLEVLCWPFVPPVHGILDDGCGTPVAPGVGIALPPDNKLKLTGNVVVVGDLGERAHFYHARNPVQLGRGAVDRSGERLERYSAHDYIWAVGQVVMFVGAALRGTWDCALRDLCDKRRPSGLVSGPG
jgi:hypothetical protein